MQDDATQELILQTFHCHGEINDCGLGERFRSIRRIRQLGSDIQPEIRVNIAFLVTDNHLEGLSNPNKVLL